MCILMSLVFSRPGSELITSKVWAEVLGISTGLTAVLLPKSHMKVKKLEYNIMELMIKTSKCVVLGVICFVSRLEVLEGLKCHTPPVEVTLTFRRRICQIYLHSRIIFNNQGQFCCWPKIHPSKWTICSINSNAVLVARPLQAICPWFFNPPIHTDSMTPRGEKMRRCTCVICKVPPSARCHGKGRGL